MINLMTPLKKARLARRLTLEQVEKDTSINTGSLSRYENINQIPTPERAAQLAEYFAPEITEMHILYPRRYMETEAEESAEAVAG